MASRCDFCGGEDMGVGAGAGLQTHLAGQQAGLLFASKRQTWPFWQHMLLNAAPWSAQL